MNLFASLAEFEREVIRERTQAGLSAARAEEDAWADAQGLPRKAEATAYAAETLYREGQLSAQEIAHKPHISKSTLYAYLRARGVPIGTSRGQPGTPPTTRSRDVGAHQTDLSGSPVGARRLATLHRAATGVGWSCRTPPTCSLRTNALSCPHSRDDRRSCAVPDLYAGSCCRNSWGGVRT